ncbi:MAG: cytochrome c [Chelatococcus sp.]|uniref:c-type cytochrome n=1 Tax=unclassified Chelatococcus TaxID=2638111 RepID=UPI001BCAABB7|nr:MULTISPECIES: cytochrome c [unclassified Chelatococcus]CAH1667221.1 Cytochrome c556 [Hyphomicrobiales bacterium]MBS7737999.1 cytochrome c [Chelatococcus sp. HY11]MBX3536121.1 cytochrome c [Chelatococcus sp.]MBX3546362.1 cytochrome c [Chelatococcus sp.]MCO5077656.1 cytochrome c [Chelatococcus sp.]
MIRSVLVAMGLVLGVTAGIAQTDPIAERQQEMKDNGQASRIGAGMVRGQEPFDLAKAQQVFNTYIHTADNFGKLFPDSSKTGKTAASPKIWEDRAGFDAALAKFGDEARKGLAETKDLETFKVAFSAIGRSCGACHEGFRVKQN